MDPDELLARYRAHVAKGRALADGEAVTACDELLDAVDLIDELFTWMGKGGFPPVALGPVAVGRPLGRLE